MWDALAGAGQVLDQNLQAAGQWEAVPPGTDIKKIPALFPRIQTEPGT